MRSSYRLLWPPRSRLMPVAAAAPIALLAGRSVAAAQITGWHRADPARGSRAAAAPPGLLTSQPHVNGVQFCDIGQLGMGAST
jgi:hypothetical protein